MMFVVALLLSCISGYLFTLLCLRCNKFAHHFLFTLPLAMGFGLGIFAFTFVILMLLNLHTGIVLFTTDLFIPLCLFIIYLYAKTKKHITDKTCSIKYSPQKLPFVTNIILHISLFLAVFLSVARFVLYAIVVRNGAWDAVSTWNLHALFMVLKSPFWQNMFSNKILWSNGDYPLLLPATIARFWIYIGTPTTIVPTVISLIFPLGIIILLYASLRIFRTKSHGVLACLLLLATPSFMNSANAQYADLPISFFLLLAMSLVCLYHKVAQRNLVLVMTGMAIGFCVFTKNEGSLLMIAILLAQYFQGGIKEIKKIFFLILGLAPFVSLTWFVKIFYAPAAGLITESSSNGILSRISNPARYIEIFRLFVHYTYTFGDFKYNITFILFILIMLFGLWGDKKYRKLVFYLFLTVGLILVGYFTIYLLTPFDLEWHIASSLQRLYIQVWPTAIFAVFMNLNTIEELLKNKSQV